MLPLTCGLKCVCMCVMKWKGNHEREGEYSGMGRGGRKGDGGHMT